MCKQGRKLLVVGTTSSAAVMGDMGVTDTFNTCLHVSALREPAIRAVLQQQKAFRPEEVRMRSWPNCGLDGMACPPDEYQGACIPRGLHKITWNSELCHDKADGACVP